VWSYFTVTSAHYVQPSHASPSDCHVDTADPRVDSIFSSIADTSFQGFPPSQPATQTGPGSPTQPNDSRSQSVPSHVFDLYHITVQQTTLVPETCSGLRQLLTKHSDAFATGPMDIGFFPLFQHDIDTGDHSPIKQSPRRPPLASRDSEDDVLTDMLKTGVIEPSHSPWTSPVCLVKKRVFPFLC
jgi:hypothetical protein